MRGHPHHCRTQHSSVKDVPWLQFSDHSAVGVLARFYKLDRMVELRVKFLAHRFDALKPLLRECL